MNVLPSWGYTTIILFQMIIIPVNLIKYVKKVSPPFTARLLITILITNINGEIDQKLNFLHIKIQISGSNELYDRLGKLKLAEGECFHVPNSIQLIYPKGFVTSLLNRFT